MPADIINSCLCDLLLFDYIDNTLLFLFVSSIYRTCGTRMRTESEVYRGDQ